MTERQSWHLSKSVPITFIVALLAHFGVTVWQFSAMTVKLDQNSNNIVKLSDNVSTLSTAVQTLATLQSTQHSEHEAEITDLERRANISHANHRESRTDRKNLNGAVLGIASSVKSIEKQVELMTKIFLERRDEETH